MIFTRFIFCKSKHRLEVVALSTQRKAAGYKSTCDSVDKPTTATDCSKNLSDQVVSLINLNYVIM